MVVVAKVLDDAAVGHAIVLGAGAHSPMALQFAADHADRVDGLVLVNPLVHFAQGPDFPTGPPPETIESLLASIDPLAVPGSQYSDDDLTVLAPSHAADPAFRSWWTRSARRAASPIVAIHMNRTLFEADLRATLARIGAPRWFCSGASWRWSVRRRAAMSARTSPAAATSSWTGQTSSHSVVTPAG